MLTTPQRSAHLMVQSQFLRLLRIISLFVSKNRSQKLINAFVSEQSPPVFACIVFEYVFVVPLDWYHYDYSCEYATSGTSPLDCLVSYAGHSLDGGLTPPQRWNRCILQPQPTGQSRSNGRIYTYPKVITPKVKLILRLELELADYDIAV